MLEQRVAINMKVQALLLEKVPTKFQIKSLCNLSMGSLGRNVNESANSCRELGAQQWWREEEEAHNPFQNAQTVVK